MARKRWPTYGYDTARVNAHIGRTTGKWGKLKEPDEVWDYLEQNLNNQSSILHAPEPESLPPLKHACGLQAARLLALKDHNVKIYTVDASGDPKDLEREQMTEKDGAGRVWRCQDCNGSYTEWAKWVDHSLAARDNGAVV